MCGNSDGIRVRPNKEHGDKMKQTNCKHVISRYESGDKPKITEEVMWEAKLLVQNFLKKSTVCKNDIKESLKEII